MEVYTSTDAVPADFGPSVVAIGKFDGVHLGHRRVLARVRQLAAERALEPVAVTFDRNPLSLLRPESCPPPLVSNGQKLELLAGQGMAATLMVTFDRAFADQSPEEFVDRVLVRAVGARVVLVGEDFRFGARGAGDVAALARLGAERGFEVEVIAEVDVERTDGEPRRASSTWIRELLDEGDVRSAAELLGRNPVIRAVVVRGAQRGRELGFPTANLSPDIEGFVPRDGVYAAWLEVDGERWPAAVSIGDNPTFEGVPAKQVEAFVLDARLDLYDRTVQLEFVDWVRPMVAFEGVPQLIERIGDDVERVRVILGVPRP